jgi:hypothetical protein
MRKKIWFFLTFALLAVLVSNAQSDCDPVTTLNDTAASIVYNVGNGVADWQYFSGNCISHQCDEHSSNLVAGGGSVFQGASVAIPFTGTGITWIGKHGPNYGIASWSLDGGPETLLDNYNPTKIEQNPNLVITGLPSAPHILRIMLTASTHGSDYWQTVDALKVTGSLLTFPQGTVAGWNNYSLLSFSGSHWGGGANPDDLSGGHWWNGTAGEKVSWTFSGKTLIAAWGRPDVEDGVMNVYLDGALVKTTSLRYGNVDNDANNSVLIFAAKVSTAPHTITLSPAGFGDGGQGLNFVQLDQFAAW